MYPTNTSASSENSINISNEDKTSGEVIREIPTKDDLKDYNNPGRSSDYKYYNSKTVKSRRIVIDLGK